MLVFLLVLAFTVIIIASNYLGVEHGPRIKLLINTTVKDVGFIQDVIFCGCKFVLFSPISDKIHVLGLNGSTLYSGEARVSGVFVGCDETTRSAFLWDGSKIPGRLYVFNLTSYTMVGPVVSGVR